MKLASLNRERNKERTKRSFQRVHRWALPLFSGSIYLRHNTSMILILTAHCEKNCFEYPHPSGNHHQPCFAPCET